MGTTRINFLTKSITSSVVPAAEGKVAVKSDKNNNYVIQIEVTNLASSGGVDHQQILN